MADSGTVTLSFGAAGSTEATAAVSDTGVLVGSRVGAGLQVPASDSPRYRDEYWVEDLDVSAGNIDPGVGFTVYAVSRGGAVVGDFTATWVRV